jgi:hypothetical protein
MTSFVHREDARGGDMMISLELEHGRDADRSCRRRRDVCQCRYTHAVHAQLAHEPAALRNEVGNNGA